MSTVSHLKRVLVPVDLSEASKTILEYAAALARHCGAPVDVLHVWEPPKLISPELTMATANWTLADLETRAVALAKQEVEALIARAELSGLRVRGLVEVGEPVASIRRVAEREGTDLVVMGTHSRTGLEKLLLGSVAQRIVATAPCPVLTMNPYPGRRH